jgi:hypothetical protein
MTMNGRIRLTRRMHLLRYSLACLAQLHVAMSQLLLNVAPGIGLRLSDAVHGAVAAILAAGDYDDEPRCPCATKSCSPNRGRRVDGRGERAELGQRTQVFYCSLCKLHKSIY